MRQLMAIREDRINSAVSLALTVAEANTPVVFLSLFHRDLEQRKDPWGNTEGITRK